MLAPKSNPFMAVEELRFVKQGSMNSGEFHALHCEKMQISLHQGRRKAIRDAIFLGMNSTKARDKAINLMNEEEKELGLSNSTVRNR